MTTPIELCNSTTIPTSQIRELVILCSRSIAGRSCVTQTETLEFQKRTGGFFKDGTQNVASAGGYTPSSADMSDGNLKFYIGRRYFGASDEDYMYGSFDLAEVILAEASASGLSTEIRQKTEGYLAHKWG